MKGRIPFATWITFTLNVAVFAYFSVVQDTLMFDSIDDQLEIFWRVSNFNPFTLGSEPWRLITSMFMHGNVLHIVMNMIALMSIGMQLESEEGSFSFVMVYFITGIAAGLASIWLNLYVSSVGASGAIFGLFGYYIVREIFRRYKDRRAMISLVISFVVFAAINYLAALLLEYGPFNMMMDTVAHLGGLATGALLAALVSVFRNSIAVFGLGVLAVLNAYFLVPNEQKDYYDVFQSLLMAEKHEGGLRSAKTDDAFLDSIRVVAREWASVSSRLRALKSVPEALQPDTLIISQYARLRHQWMTFQTMQIEKESYVYRDSLEIVEAELDSLPRLKYILNYHLPAEKIEQDEKNPGSGTLQHVTVFYDRQWREITSMENAAYFREGQYDSLKRWQGPVRDYFANGQVQMKGNYLNSMNHGVFLYYTKSKKYESAGRYDHDEPVGKWEYYYPNGKLHREIDYNKRVSIRNVYDTLGKFQVRDGNGYDVSFYPGGQVEEEGPVVNGTREGVWKGYYADGKPFFEEHYRGGRLIQGKSVDRNGHRYVYDASSLYPLPVVGIEKYRRYLESSVRPIPGVAKEGVVEVTFSVDEDGTTRDFIVTKSLCGDCDQEAIRVIKEGPSWRPSLQRGFQKTPSKTAVDVTFIMK